MGAKDVADVLVLIGGSDQESNGNATGGCRKISDKCYPERSVNKSRKPTADEPFAESWEKAVGEESALP
ncbi:MAG TPA: hypothetical protein VFM62_03895 [Arthrobacter sp.]|nr:hypothetical protein [Arthrobacter sp.]